MCNYYIVIMVVLSSVPFKISHLLKDAVFIFQDEVGLVKTVLLDKKKSKEIQTLDNYFYKRDFTVYQFSNV